MHGYNTKFTVPQRPHECAAEQHFVHSRACSCHLCLLPGQPVTREEAPWPPVTPPPHTPPSASCFRLQQLLKMLNVINTFPIKCIVFSCSWILCFVVS